MYNLENNVELTDKIKQAFKKGLTRAYLKYDDIEINPDNYLMSVEYSDEKADPQDGRFIGKAICRSIDIKLNNKANNLNLENKELEYYLGALVDGQYVYIKFGNFIVQKPENQEVNEETTFTALDYMSKFDVKYIPTITFPNTIGNIAQDICNQCGVELGNIQFRNSDKVIQANPFTNNEQCREVIKSIAKVSFTSAYIWQDNKLYFGFEKNDVITETISIDNYYEMEKNNEIKPITIVTLRSSEVEASGQSIRNAELIEQYGPNELIIEEDYFAFTDTLRQTFLQEASALFGLTYHPISIDLEGSVYLSFNDTIQITNLKGENLKTYCFNNNHTYNGTLYNNISVPALTETEEKYIYQDEDETKRTKTAIEIDKANGKITQVVEQVNEQNSKISQITQTVDELNSKIGEVADVTITGESYNAQVFLEGINASEPILIKIRPYLQSISALYPSKSLFPGKGVYPRGKPKLIFFDKDNNYMRTYILPDNLNYIDENTYDEFLLDYENQICSVTKRVGIDENGALYKLDIPHTTQYDDYPTIILEDGNYNIYLDTYNNGYLFVKLMSANIYTSQFATKVELNSEITQTTNKINLELEKKVDEEKVTGANIMLAINGDTSNATINADKIDLSGKEINLTSDDININSTNFKVDKYGNVTSNNLTASNATINGTMTTTAPTGSKVQMANGAMVTYMANSNIGIEIGGSNIFVRSPNDGVRSGYIGSALTTSSGIKPLTIFGTNDKDIYLGTTSGDFETSGQRVTTALRISSDAVYNYLPITSASDKRLKYDIEQIDTNIIKAISECEILQFKIKNRNGNISVGIIAQELIEKCNKYNVSNIFDYEIIRETQYLIDDDTFYYVIDYNQYLILKIKAQEIELENQQKTINNLIERIERLEEK